MKRGKTKAEKTRERIIQTFFDLAAESQEALPNVGEICAEMDIYRSTFYNYFSNIEELIEAASYPYERQLRELHQGIIRKMERSQGYADDSFAMWFQPMMQHLAEHRKKYQVLLSPKWNLPFLKLTRQMICKSLIADMLPYESSERVYAADFITEGIIVSIYRWLLTADISVEDFTVLQVKLMHLN